ncbi:early nodulin-93-like [Actinidia eriantha]|uniref:early nodulin-93-like n=1 Tax=Actinidia eriantha TaxID=165200 RepID=UPI00258B3B0A|nr:early nodulin-93-like [Actinidia eriantha]
MGILSTTRDEWANRRNSPLIASPAEDQKILGLRDCPKEGVRAGAKAAAIAAVVSAVPTVILIPRIPWAKASLNYTAKALIVSTASIAAYFITADKTILECARCNSRYRASLIDKSD